MTNIVVVVKPRRPIQVTDVRWESPELHLGLRAQIADERAPIIDERRRRQALTTTASGAIG
jgi:hypothetical protein